MSLERRVEQLEKKLKDMEQNRLRTMNINEVETMKHFIFEREASATLPSGAVVRRHLITSYNGYRYAIPAYDRFNPLA